MKKKIRPLKKIFILSVLSLFATLSFAQGINIAKIDSFISHIEQQNQGIGAMAISKAGKQIYSRRFGSSYFPKKEKSRELKYRVGSITKLLTATLIYQLSEKGQLHLDETLDKYFPEIPNASKITIVQLLGHTSGLGSYVFRNDSMWTVRPATEPEIMNEIKTQGCSFEPGKEMRYSNSGYYLLTKILEKVYGKDYPQIVNQQILLPLGMTHSLSGVAEAPGIAPSYHLNTHFEWKESVDFYFPNVTGVGDLASTPEDLNIFLNALFNGKLVSQESVQQMMPEGKRMYGRGIMQAPYLDKILYGHGGATLGTRSMALNDRETDTAISISVNGVSTPFEEILVGIMNGIYDLPNPLKDYSQNQKYQADEDDFQQYEGEYKSRELPFRIQIYKVRSDLMMKVSGESAVCLEGVDKDIFQVSPANVSIEFYPGSKKLFFIQKGVKASFERK